MEVNEKQWEKILKKGYGDSVHPYFIEDFPNGLRFCGNRFCLLYEFPNGYAIYQIVGYKQYELKKIIGEVPEELLKGLDNDANHRALISREYDTKTPVLPYDKQKSNIMDKLIQTCLNWRNVYTFWTISFVIFVAIHLLIDTPLETRTFQIMWWIIGSITTLIGIYHLIKKQWLDELLYLCLFLFPIIAYKTGHILKESLQWGL